MKSIYNRCTINALLCIVLLVVLAGTGFSQTESQGPFCGRNYASNPSNDGTHYWTNASAARCDEDATRTATDPLGEGQYTQYLHISDFGFNIPADARVNGIEVVVIRRSDHPNAVRDRSVMLLRYGQVIGNNKAVPEPWDTEWTGVYYGGEIDQWGSKWTPADLNRRDFGLVLDVGHGAAAGQPQVDEVVVTVHYTPANKNVQTVNLARVPSKFTCLNLGS